MFDDVVVIIDVSPVAILTVLLIRMLLSILYFSICFCTPELSSKNRPLNFFSIFFYFRQSIWWACVILSMPALWTLIHHYVTSRGVIQHNSSIHSCWNLLAKKCWVEETIIRTLMCNYKPKVIKDETRCIDYIPSEASTEVQYIIL